MPSDEKVTWKDVEDKVTKEEGFAAENEPDDKANIISFYPELIQRTQSSNNWSTLSNLPLIPGILSANHTLVDVNPWKNETELIKSLGVNKAGLKALARKKIITLTPNLSPDDYISCEWMYDLLADENTLWRYFRTPAFYKSLEPSLEEAKGQMFNVLFDYFSRLSENDFQNICQNINNTFPPTKIKNASRLLSVWYSYVYAHNKETANEIWQDFMRNPINILPDIRELYFTYAPTDSAALGGIVRINEDQISNFLKTKSIEDTKNVNITAKEIIESLSEITTDLKEERLTGEDYWKRHGEEGVDPVIRFLEKNNAQQELIEAEKNIRKLIYNNPNELESVNRIKAYINDLDKYVEKLEKWKDSLMGFSTLAAFVQKSWLTGELTIPFEQIVYINAPRLYPSFDRAMGRVPTKIIEKLFPQLQIVRFARKYRKS